jgi:hypothetical protein
MCNINLVMTIAYTLQLWAFLLYKLNESREQQFLSSIYNRIIL